MKHNMKYLNMAAGACLAALSGMAHGEDAPWGLAVPSITSPYTNGSRSYVLAMNDAGGTGGQASAATTTQAKEFEPPLFSGSNVHKYLGLGTLALVVATVVAPKPAEIEDRAPTQAELDEQDRSAHARIGRAAALFGAATATTGFLAHWDDFHLEDGWSDPDNLHALLGTAGALAMMAAISQAPEGGHAGTGMLGGVAMGVAIKLTW